MVYLLQLLLIQFREYNQIDLIELYDLLISYTFSKNTELFQFGKNNS